MIIAKSVSGQVVDVDRYPIYKGNDLGMVYNKETSSFKIWSPFAEKAEIIFFKTATGNDEIESLQLES